MGLTDLKGKNPSKATTLHPAPSIRTQQNKKRSMLGPKSKISSFKNKLARQVITGNLEKPFFSFLFQATSSRSN